MWTFFLNKEMSNKVNHNLLVGSAYSSNCCYLLHGCLLIILFCYITFFISLVTSYNKWYKTNFLLPLCRKPGKENLFRCTYVLPDGVTHTKGFVKYPEQAHRYLTLTDDATSSPSETKENVNYPEMSEKLEDRKRIDLTKNVFCILLFIF